MPEESEKPNKTIQPNPSDNSAATGDHPSRPWMNNATKKNRKKLWIIITSVAVVMLGGGWTAYALWYQSPDKVVFDALSGAIVSKTFAGKGLVVTSGKTSSSFSFDGKFGYKEGGSLVLTGTSVSNVVLDSSGGFYLKADHFESAYQRAIDKLKSATSNDPLRQSIMSALDLIVAPKIKTLDGKWVRIGADDIKSISTAHGELYACLHDTFVGLNGDVPKLIEIGLKYQSNQFLVVSDTLPARSGNAGYVVTIDNAKLKSFLDSLKPTKFYGDIAKCAVNAGSPLNIDQMNVNGSSRPSFELRISQWGHQLKELKTTSSTGKGGNISKTTFDMTTDFNVPVTVSAPKNFVPFKQVLPDVSSLFGLTMLQYLPSSQKN